MMARLPLALFVYNRPRHTRRALEAIERMSRLGDVELMIFCDAAKSPAHERAVRATREVVRAYASRHRASIVERQSNLGLAKSIAGTVGELTDAFGAVVVLEDDLVPTPDFLSYMLEGLDRYRDSESVLQISGCLLPGSVPARTDGFFLPLTTTWGWATWRRAWSLFQPVSAADRALLDLEGAFKSRFTAQGAVDYVSMLEDRLAGRNDSWGIWWWFAVARANGLVLYPRQSLIWNGGFDASGVHCGGAEVFRSRPPEAFELARLGWPLSMPETLSVDAEAWTVVRNFLKGDGPRPADQPSARMRLRSFLRGLLTRQR